MSKQYFDLGAVHERCHEAWFKAMTVGGDFSIADALGPDHTATLLNSSIAGHIPILGAISGVIDALANKSEAAQQRAIDQNIPFSSAGGLHIDLRNITAAGRWISTALQAKRRGDSDPMDSIDQDLVDEVSGTSSQGSALRMSMYLAAVTLVGAAASYPDTPPQNFKFAIELAAIADAAQQGVINASTIQVIINDPASLNIGAIHGDHNIVVSGDRNRVSQAQTKSTAGEEGSVRKRFWSNPGFYGWMMAAIALATLAVTWLSAQH
ncbi:MAG TPA: hypothetical protein H9830_02630 [Candidatus Agrococcus pullicola]|uniref:Uncharacterized protein n=1 Tax=Candidatus Agrococcus pullicola TaxID=2838429 RepID=A0A9D1YT59_9MICO|nr:hypothetical protein [Candidatus Agrococcus pullicola]